MIAVSGELRLAFDDGPPRCTYCPAEAAGPCASCHASICGDCCTLTEHSSKPWAICLACARKNGRSLRGAWRSFGLWLVGILLALAAVVVLLEWLA
jgi:hypothetical protein